MYTHILYFASVSDGVCGISSLRPKHISHFDKYSIAFHENYKPFLPHSGQHSILSHFMIFANLGEKWLSYSSSHILHFVYWMKVSIFSSVQYRLYFLFCELFSYPLSNFLLGWLVFSNRDFKISSWKCSNTHKNWAVCAHPPAATTNGLHAHSFSPTPDYFKANSW